MPKKSRQSRKIRMHVPGVPGAMALGASGGRRRRQRGGFAEAQAAPAPAPYSDAASYVYSNYGDGNTQWNNVYGPQSTSTMGNEIVNLNHPQMVQAGVPQGGGRRRRRRGGSNDPQRDFDNNPADDDDYEPPAPYVPYVPPPSQQTPPPSPRPLPPVSQEILRGGRRRRGSRKGKRGGFFGNVVSQAIVPFGLLALQNKYSRSLRHKRGGTRKYRK